MKKQENNFDEIDKILFKAFENSPDVPDSTKHTIHNAFKLPRKQKKKNYVYSTLQKVAIFIVTFTILTTSVVFAKDIINFITNLFTNSTKAIDTAVANGYIQNVDMDFIFDNNIGIKTNNLVIDENNLDISFTYYTDIANITNMEIHEYIIRDENNNIIGVELDDYANFNEPNKISSRSMKSGTKIIDSNNKFTESILYSSLELPKLNSLTFEIKSFILTNSNDKQKKYEGNWLYTINIDNNIMKRNTEKYSTSYNEVIKSISAEQSETSLKIELTLNEEINEDVLLKEIDNIKLTNILNEKYPYFYMYNNNDENNNGHLIIEFDISKYFENTNSLNLYIKYNTDKSLNVHLLK